MLGEINKLLEPYKPNIYLAKPDRTIVCKLSEAYDINITQNLNGIHEVSLKVPYQISKYNKNSRNDHVDLIRGHYLLRVDNDWFVISNNQSNSSKESMQVEAKLLPYQLRRKTIFSLSEEKNATDILNICLADTPWTVAYVDAEFALQKRKFEINEKTKLEFLFDIAEAYDGVLKFNTENLSISLYKLENIGSDKGLSISYGKYLKDIDKKPNFDDVCTRLYVYGKDGLDISSVNLTGTAYIEDFSYYMHPYNETITDVQNDLYTVNTHSHYMSDELCHAILKYNNALENEKSNFIGLADELATLTSQLSTLQEELNQLNENLLLAKDDLAIHNARNNGVEDQSLIGAVTDAESAYNAKLSEIEVKNIEIDTVNNGIASLRNRLDLSDYFDTPQLLQERDQFIFERKWTNDSYNDINDLYERGILELKKTSQPQIAYSLNIIDFLKVVECQHDCDKLAIGDIVTVKYDKFNVDIKAKIIKIAHNIDSNKLNIEIANTKDINRGFYEWVDLLKKSVSTSAVLNTNKYKWDEGYTANSKIENYINSKIDAAKQAIVAGVNQSVNIDRQGIKINDPDDHDNFIRILHNVLAFTNDGGNTFKHAITPDGIIAEYILGKIILGSQVTIGNNDGTLEILGNKITISDLSENERAILGEYDLGKYGLKLKDVTGNTTLLDEDGIMQTWQEGMAENADKDDPVKLYIYLPPETKSIHKCILRFKREAYRAYSKTSSDGGGGEATCNDGGGKNFTSAGLISLDSPSELKTQVSGEHCHGISDGALLRVGGTNKTVSPAGGHTHGLNDGVALSRAGGGSVTYSILANHDHGIGNNAVLTESSTDTFKCNLGHDHIVKDHLHPLELPNHEHKIILSNHTHGLNFGIYEGSFPTNITIKINGIDKTTELGGNFNVDQDNLDIAQYIRIGDWNEIELGTSTLGRINATIFIQAKMGV